MPLAARCLALLSASAAALAGAWGCRRPGNGGGSGAEFPVFTDVSRESGIAFLHDNGFDGRRYRVVETVNGGVALLDYDGDGFLDVYFTNGRKIEAGASPPRDALYKSKGDGTFTDVTEAAGVGDEHLTLGVSVADVDGDGDPDVYITNLGPNRLYRNNGNGTFTDIAPEAGLASETLDTGSAFLDMENDGDLDLYVASYVIDDGKEHRPCMVRGFPGYWPPRNYPAAPHKLFANQGNGRFIDVSKSSGIHDVEPGRGLGVIAADFNDDGKADIYVANDTTANFMFLGDGKGRFRDVGLASGTAIGDDGDEQGSMGVEAQDYDGDGKLDLLVTNYQDETNNLFRWAGADSYQDMARIAGVADGTLPEVAWGVGLVDLDNDGWKDLFIANGHLNPHAHEMDESTAYAQRKRIHRNLGNGRFEEATGRAGAAVQTPRVSRGAAFGDLDNDGDVDVVVIDANGAPEVLRNDGGNNRGWLKVMIVDSGLNRDAIGARVTILAGGASQIGERRSSGSYLSASDGRLHFGLGPGSGVDRLEVRWPGGEKDVLERVPSGKLIRVTKGKPGFETILLPRWAKR
jgi:hypothetical protein